MNVGHYRRNIEIFDTGERTDYQRLQRNHLIQSASLKNNTQ